MDTDGPARRLLPYGADAVLVECADLADTRALQAHLDGDLPDVIDEIVAGARTLLLRLRAPLPRDLADTLRTVRPPALDATNTQTVEILVHYDGADLAEVADLTGLTPSEVISVHTGQSWTVAFCGFAPGFAYLAGDERLRVPRRASPRTSVPPGSVGLADQWSGIYPRAAPGGWQLIGRTSRQVWDLDRDPPALLQPGTRVRFVDAEDRSS